MHTKVSHFTGRSLFCLTAFLSMSLAGTPPVAEGADFAQIALEIDPKAPGTTTAEKKLRLAALYHAGDSRQVELATATEIEPEEVDIYVHLLGLRMKLEKGDLYFGRKHLERMLREHPNNPVVLGLAAQYELQKEFPDTEKAIGFLRRAVENNPYSAEAHYQLAKRTKDYSEMLQCCAKILFIEKKGSSVASRALELLESKKNEREKNTP